MGIARLRGSLSIFALLPANIDFILFISLTISYLNSIEYRFAGSFAKIDKEPIKALK